MLESFLQDRMQRPSVFNTDKHQTLCSPDKQSLCWSLLQADSLCYQTEKQVKEYGDKVPAEVKTKIEEKVTSLRESINNNDVEGMKAGIEALNQVYLNVHIIHHMNGLLQSCVEFHHASFCFHVQFTS